MDLGFLEIKIFIISEYYYGTVVSMIILVVNC